MQILTQLARKFDGITLKKMLVSALLLAGGAALMYVSDNLLRLLGAFGIPDSMKTVVALGLTWFINTVREWWSGEEIREGLTPNVTPPSGGASV